MIVKLDHVDTALGIILFVFGTGFGLLIGIHSGGEYLSLVFGCVLVGLVYLFVFRNAIRSLDKKVKEAGFYEE